MAIYNRASIISSSELDKTLEIRREIDTKVLLTSTTFLRATRKALQRER